MKINENQLKTRSIVLIEHGLRLLQNCQEDFTEIIVILY